MTKKASEESVEIESDRVEPVGCERWVPCHVEVSKFTAPMLAYYIGLRSSHVTMWIIELSSFFSLFVAAKKKVNIKLNFS